ncbi:D,D-heptose 7-phosphate kinase [Desulfocucumis palustris]|uniref:D,D-heptose 7-phosphate kinase n=1 Tax=Desulfocucumis palustris TaxID=1898651 RepID=A0A2L2XHS1_9FIRM|nr:kinase [Desulfocucumis palustris]GBF33431.1 D,D-heptose 7-phosphate kinase [Desulfocucumis palustris]
MIISRTPLRVSFFGGGTDYPIWYKEHGGKVIATSINKYSYVICRYCPPFFDYNYCLRYRKREETKTVEEIKHPSIRECLRWVSLSRGVEIQHNADLPAMSGLGSSSAFTVGLLNALYALKGQLVTKEQLALEAIHVEQNLIRESVGSQDQTITAFGGFNRVRFGGATEILVEPITIDLNNLRALENHLMLFFVGFPRVASEIARKQIEVTPGKQAELNTMMNIVDEAVKILKSGPERIDDFGRLLHEQWLVKRGITSLISNSLIDQVYEAGRECGALGGKLLGAGGGGFFLFYARPQDQPKIRERLKTLLYVPFSFDYTGTQIIYYLPEEFFQKTSGNAVSGK